MANQKRGFVSMDEEKKRDTARKDGKGQGKEDNPGNLAHERENARSAGTKGGNQ